MIFELYLGVREACQLKVSWDPREEERGKVGAQVLQGGGEQEQREASGESGHRAAERRKSKKERRELGQGKQWWRQCSSGQGRPKGGRWEPRVCPGERGGPSRAGKRNGSLKEKKETKREVQPGKARKERPEGWGSSCGARERGAPSERPRLGAFRKSRIPPVLPGDGVGVKDRTCTALPGLLSPSQSRG